jgi:hypothetical protein
MNMLKIKLDFLELVGYLKKMDIIHDEHCRVVEHMNTGDSGMNNTGKAATLAAAVLDTTLEEAHIEVPATRRLTVNERSPDMEGCRTRLALESSRPESRRLASTPRSVRARSTTCLTVLTLGRTKLWPCCPSTRKRGIPTRRRRTLRLWATTERRRKTEMARPRISRQRIFGVKVTVLADTGSDYSAIPRSAVEDARKRGFPLKVEVLPEPIMLNMAIRGESDKQKCSAKEMLMSAVTITTPSGPL